MRPLDPRLLRLARSTRSFIVFAIVIGAATAAVVIVQARLLSTVIVDVSGAGTSPSDVGALLAGVALAFAARALLASGSEVVAHRASAAAKQELRASALREVLDRGPAGPAGRDPGGLATLLTRGIDGMDAYFARYLPQVILSVIVPIAILATVVGQDLLSALIIAVTLPLIPIFMILVGLYTKGRVDRQWRTLAILSGHFLDLIAGLPTLKVFGRAKAQAIAIRSIGERYRTSTMAVLRISFLSSLVLELLASLSVALVAVSIGIRLAEGQVTYGIALFVLLLAPEAYLPLRMVGQHFHAAAEGLGAADRILGLIEGPGVDPAPAPSAAAVPAKVPVLARITQIRVEEVSVDFGRGQPALAPTTFTAISGELTALIGPSGAGKTTLLNVLLGFIPPTSGRIMLVDDAGREHDLRQCRREDWLAQIGWVPQRAHLVDRGSRDTPSIRATLSVSDPGVTDALIWRALEQAGIADEVRALPHGLETIIRSDGSGLSVGQQQRIALARALVRRPNVLLLDEPTAALDGHSETAVVAAVAAAVSHGAIAIVVAHRPALVQQAHQLVRIEAGSDDPHTTEFPFDLEPVSVPGSRGW